VSELRVLQDSPVPDAAGVVGEVWDRPGRALCGLARVLFEDVDEAESVVVRAVLDACTPADMTVSGVGRRELARYVYVLWRRGNDARTGSDMSVASGAGMVGELSAPQRSAVALGLFGEHTYAEIAGVMGLPAAEVAELMRSGLLLAGRRSPRPHGPPAPRRR
jgi:hypothetical protein